MGYIPAYFTICLCFLCLPPISSKIWSDKYLGDGIVRAARREYKTSDEVEEPMAVTRRRRSAVDTHLQAASAGKLRVHVTTLPDAKHNEAIVHWTGKNSSVMFILSREHNINDTVLSSTLWRSENYGSSFSEVKKFPAGTVISYYLSAPNDKFKLLFVDKMKNRIFTTQNEGNTFQEVMGCPVSTDKLVFHPVNDSMILCYCEREHKLYVTVDFCKSWDLVHEYVNPRFFWGVPNYDTDMNIIHMEVLDPFTGHYVYKAVTYPYPRDVTVENDIGMIEVDSLLVINEYIFVQKSSQFSSWLYVSWKRQHFQMAYFPRNHHPQDLNIIDADESQVFIAGSQPSTGLFYTLSELYLSDTRGQIYISSLGHVTSIGLKEVHGLRGVYTANQKFGIGNSASLRTKITFDQGGKWSLIPAPEKDPRGNPINCKLEHNCSLHLTHVVSEATAPGILLGQGNYGRGLTGFDNITLFMSTDGGLTWKCTLNKTDYYEANILDQGGAMVAVPQSLASNKNVIHYTHDEGLTWQEFIYKNDSMRVDAVLNDPGATTRTVIIFGHDERERGWVVVMVDFSDILKKQCTDSDYVNWFPTDQIEGHQCLLGQKMTYQRRKPAAECFNGLSHVNVLTVKACPCIMEDYECDYGYELQQDMCKPAKWFDPDKPVGPCPEGTYYNKSKGYRKVAADKCTNDIAKLIPVKTKCPKMKAEGLHIMLVTHHIIPVNTPVQFLLLQERGSKQSTKYSWTFGDGPVTTTVIGFDNAKNQTHSYEKRGHYQVTVTASNGDGDTTVSLNVIVEDNIKGLVVETPHGAQVNKPILFEVSVYNDLDLFFRAKPGVHFMWRFGDEENEKDQKLTWDTSVMHTYKSAGNYSVLVEAMNGGDTLFQIINVPVYGTLTTVQLTFDAVVSELNDGTLLWNNMFVKVLKEALMKHLAVDSTRIEVVVLKDTTRTIADVSVLPLKQTLTHDDTMSPIVKSLMKLPKSDFTVPLTRDEFQMSYNAKVTSVHIVTEETDNAKSYIAVYVCVPILVGAIFVSVLVVLYYKKTFSSANRRYRLLRNQGDGPEPDSLLDNTDDDDLPLDLNADDSNQRLALSDDERPVSWNDPLSLLQADRRNVDV